MADTLTDAEVAAILDVLTSPVISPEAKPLWNYDRDGLKDSVVSALALEVQSTRALQAHWCKEGETLAERLARERADSLALMGLLAAEKAKVEAHRAKRCETCAQWDACGIAAPGFSCADFTPKEQS